MAERYSLGLCLFDFVPNLAFLVGAWFLVQTARLARGRRCAWLMAGGSLLILLGGTLKAIWKLLFTLGAGDVRILSEAQFALLAPGFLLLLTSVVILARGDRLGAGMGSQQPVMALVAWKVPLLVVMTFCSIGAYGLLSWIAFRRGARLAGVMFVFAVLGLFLMSGMSGADQTVTHQWIEQGINSAGQSALALGSFGLHRSYIRTRPEVGYA